MAFFEAIIKYLLKIGFFKTRGKKTR